MQFSFFSPGEWLPYNCESLTGLELYMFSVVHFSWWIYQKITLLLQQPWRVAEAMKEKNSFAKIQESSNITVIS